MFTLHYRYHLLNFRKSFGFYMFRKYVFWPSRDILYALLLLFWSLKSLLRRFDSMLLSFPGFAEFFLTHREYREIVTRVLYTQSARTHYYTNEEYLYNFIVMYFQFSKYHRVSNLHNYTKFCCAKSIESVMFHDLLLNIISQYLQYFTNIQYFKS